MSNVIDIRGGLDSKIKGIQRELMLKFQEQNPFDDGLDTHQLADLAVKQITSQDILKLIDLIDNVISEMAIVVDVTYDYKNKLFLLDFRIDNIPDKLFGSIVKIGLYEIIFHQCTYQHNLEESIIATLLYTLVQKDEVA